MGRGLALQASSEATESIDSDPGRRRENVKRPRIHNGWFVLALLATSIAAFAESPRASLAHASSPGAADSTRQWTTADKDRDGLLSREELAPFPAFSEDFAAIDSNADGKISRNEYASWRDSHREE
jgi:hypothetical protein